jgi:imidazoleglycerol phosphate synthase glutamine amidotransferase subunit HisH
MELWRNHYGFLSDKIDLYPLQKLASYDGECMILMYRNSILVQFHPERTNTGIEFMDNWLRI